MCGLSPRSQELQVNECDRRLVEEPGRTVSRQPQIFFTMGRHRTISHSPMSLTVALESLCSSPAPTRVLPQEGRLSLIVAVGNALAGDLRRIRTARSPQTQRGHVHIWSAELCTSRCLSTSCRTSTRYRFPSKVWRRIQFDTPWSRSSTLPPANHDATPATPQCEVTSRVRG